MRAIKRNYLNCAEKNPGLGAYSCLAQISVGKKYSRKSLVKAFKEIMPKGEYLRSEMKGLIDHLAVIANKSEVVEISHRFEAEHLGIC